MSRFETNGKAQKTGHGRCTPQPAEHKQADPGHVSQKQTNLYHLCSRREALGKYIMKLRAEFYSCRL